MSSPAEVLANRQNAARSTGPKSPEGKAAAAKNATRHGLSGASSVLAHESRGDSDLDGRLLGALSKSGNVLDKLRRYTAAGKLRKSAIPELAVVSILRLNSSGPDVTALQKALLAAGFNPGAIDGCFGGGTQAALLAFQRSEWIAADGVVGPATAKALGLDAVPAIPSALAAVTVQVVSRMFPSTPIGNIKTNLPPVLNALTAASLPDRAMVLMALSTIRAETECFAPISEGQSRFNTSPSGHPFDLYDNRKDLGNSGAPDGASFRGRGFVQLTGRANYTRYSEQTGQDLVRNPELANEAAIAAQLLACFLKDRENQIREALAQSDLALARRLVNGGSNGLDRFSQAFTCGARLIPGEQAEAEPAFA